MEGRLGGVAAAQPRTCREVWHAGRRLCGPAERRAKPGAVGKARRRHRHARAPLHARSSPWPAPLTARPEPQDQGPRDRSPVLGRRRELCRGHRTVAVRAREVPHESPSPVRHVARQGGTDDARDGHGEVPHRQTASHPCEVALRTRGHRGQGTRGGCLQARPRGLHREPRLRAGGPGTGSRSREESRASRRRFPIETGRWPGRVPGVSGGAGCPEGGPGVRQRRGDRRCGRSCREDTGRGPKGDAGCASSRRARRDSQRGGDQPDPFDPRIPALRRPRVCRGRLSRLAPREGPSKLSVEPPGGPCRTRQPAGPGGGRRCGGEGQAQGPRGAHRHALE